MDDGLTTSSFSRESFTTDYVVLLFMPMDGMDTDELAAFRHQVQHGRNAGGHWWSHWYLCRV